MLIFNSKANYEQQKAYLDFQIFRRKKMYLNYLITFLGLLIILVIMVIQKKYPIIIATSILMVVNTIMFVILLRRMYRVNLHQKDFSKIDELLITIDQENIHVKNKVTNEQVALPTNDLVAICDLKEYLFLYLSDNQAICLDKKDVIEGSIDEFIHHLDSDFKKRKYRKYYK